MSNEFRVSVELVVRADSMADVNDKAILDAAISDAQAREGVEFLRGSANVAPLEGCAISPMTSTHIDPELNVIALVDPHDEESGSELSEHGKWFVREKLEAIGYGHVIFLAAHVMGQYVNAGNGKWVQPDSAPVAGWTYYDSPDAEVLVDEAGIDFTDPEMWA